MSLALAQLFGAFGHTALEVGVEARELTRFAMELDENADFCSQNLGDDWD
jgi:hypothetical protein